jgi:hypothetical protein
VGLLPVFTAPVILKVIASRRAPGGEALA